MEMHYILLGDPIPLARARYGNKRVWDSQKELKLVSGLNLAQQHGKNRQFLGPLHIDAVFYMYMSQNLKKSIKVPGTYHYFKPDLDNLIKFICEICSNIAYNNDCIISSISAKKLYDSNPRTEINIKELL